MRSVEPIPNQRHLFDIPEDVAYLNCAYMGPLLRGVAEAGAAAVRQKQRPWEISSEDFFSLADRGRALFAQLIGATAEDIAIVPSISYGIETAARNLDLEAGDEVVVLADQFPSNVYPWKEKAGRVGASLKTVPSPAPPESSGSYEGWMPALLESIRPNTAIVAVPHCHWTNGGLVDLVAVRERTREVGAALVLDVAQSCGAWPLDVREVQPDYLAAACYKWLLGPYGLGFLYVAPERREGRPLEAGWIGRAGSENFAGLVDYRDDYAPGARRYDMGERAQFHLLPMAVAAMEQLLAWGVDAVAATLSERTETLAARGVDLGLVPLPSAHRAGHYLGLGFPQGIPDGLLDRLAARNVYVSIRGTQMRVTPHLHTTDRDVDALFTALAEELLS